MFRGVDTSEFLELPIGLGSFSNFLNLYGWNPVVRMKLSFEFVVSPDSLKEDDLLEIF